MWVDNIMPFFENTRFLKVKVPTIEISIPYLYSIYNSHSFCQVLSTLKQFNDFVYVHKCYIKCMYIRI